MFEPLSIQGIVLESAYLKLSSSILIGLEEWSSIEFFFQFKHPGKEVMRDDPSTFVLANF